MLGFNPIVFTIEVKKCYSQLLSLLVNGQIRDRQIQSIMNGVGCQNSLPKESDEFLGHWSLTFRVKDGLLEFFKGVVFFGRNLHCLPILRVIPW